MKKSRTHTDPYSKTILRANQKQENPSLANVNYADTPAPTTRSQTVSRTSVTYKTDHYLNCDCAPDLYNRVLGPTADEVFLKGLQTVFNVCSKFTDCGKEPDVQFQPEPTKPVPKVVSEILTSLGVPPEMASQIVQTSFAELEVKQPSLASKILQTSTPDMISKILSTVGLAPEMISEIMQVSLASLRPSVKSGVMQTTPPPSTISGFMQTSEFEEPVEIKPSLSDLSTEGPKPSPAQSLKDSPDKEDSLKMCVCCKCGQPEDNLTSKMCICCKCKKPEPRPEQIEIPKMCICCKCKKPQRPESATRIGSSKMYICCKCREPEEVPANGELVEIPKSCICKKPEMKQDSYEKMETGKMCVCCKCFTSSGNEINYVKPTNCKVVEDSFANQRQCICSKCCSVRNQEAPKKKSRSSSIIDSIKSKFEPSPKARICRCYDCSAPVIYRSHKLNDCSCPKSKPKCKCSGVNGQGRNSESYIWFGTGDTCPATETIYICEQGTGNYD